MTDGVFVPAAAEAGCDAPPAFLPARSITQADLAALGVWLVFSQENVPDPFWEKAGKRDRHRLLTQTEPVPAAAAADMLAWENSGFSVDADGRIIRIRSVLPRHKAANWVGPGRGRKSTRPGANGGVELTPFEFPSEFSDRLADLVPPPRKHRHRYHGVFALNHKLRRAVTALAKRQRRQAT